MAAKNQTKGEVMSKSTEPKYPDIVVQLSGEDGNAFFIIGRVTKAMKRAGVEHPEIVKFREQAMSEDYANVLCTAGEWVNVR